MGSGPIEGRLPSLSVAAQKAENSFNKVSMANLTKMFQGMTRAIDTGPERAKFESTQASMKMDAPVVNKTLDDQIAAIDTMIARNKARRDQFTREGDFTEQAPASEKAKNEYPKTLRKDGHTAQVSNAQEEQEAKAEGWN
jgi:hypothetical protein